MKIVLYFQSQIFITDEIVKKQCVENIPLAVKGALDDVDEKFMQHNCISKLVDTTNR